MNKLRAAIGAVALLCASQANAASIVYNEREPNDLLEQAEQVNYTLIGDDKDVFISILGSLVSDAGRWFDWFAFDVPAISTGVANYTTTVFVTGLNGAPSPNLELVYRDTNRPISAPFGSVEAGRYAVGVYGSTGQPGEYRISVFIDAIPEPTTWALMLAGFGMVGYSLRRRRDRLAFA